MKKLLISLVTVGAVGVAAFAATSAFFSDTETSTGNVLAAGAIDLKVDNTCYYNGNACVNGTWQGVNLENIGVGNTGCSCSWTSKDLAEENVFFDLSDIKPGDFEEDTISLKVNNNASWLCADVTLTSDDDVDCTEPESEDLNDPECSAPLPSPGPGELAGQINFLWWADDGDNVLEQGEQPLPGGALGNLGVGNSAPVTLADAGQNIWSPSPGPIPAGGQTFYVGKAWCYGNIAAVPAPNDPDPSNAPNQDNVVDGVINSLDGGFSCDGTGVGNASQTDKLTANIGFSAVQARNNANFLCSPKPI